MHRDINAKTIQIEQIVRAWISKISIIQLVTQKIKILPEFDRVNYGSGTN